MASNTVNAPDLTKRAPRSPRLRLGDYVILPRMLDKGRATVTGRQGEYNYACPLDQRFLEFTGIHPDALKQQIAAGKGDWEILEWIQTNSTTKPKQTDIIAWSTMQERRVPTDPESRAFFNELHSKNAQHREDIATWFDLLDLDDYVSFGGKA